MTENEKELLLNERQSKPTEKKPTEKKKEVKFNKGYVDYFECEKDCQCGGTCNKCAKPKPTCSQDCKCGGYCNKCKQNKKRASGICRGAAHIFEGKLRYLFYITLLIIVITFLLIFLVILLLLFLRHRGVSHNNATPKTETVSKRNTLCKEITAENSSLFIMGYVDAATGKAKQFIEPTRNVFYVFNKPLTLHQACGIESLLRLLTDKLVYVVEFYKDSDVGKDYVTHLQKRYVNLNRIKTNQTHFFQGSLFENYWHNSSKPLSTLAARLLSIWQFGGMTLSENILLNNRDIIDDTKEICFSDRDVVFCPQECSAYTFELMKATLHEMKTAPTDVNSIGKIIDTSINDFCSGDVAEIGCNRVYRLQKSDMCENDSGICRFIRMNNLERIDNSKQIMKQFCPLMLR